MTLSDDEVQALGEKMVNGMNQWFEEYPWDQEFIDFFGE